MPNSKLWNGQVIIINPKNKKIKFQKDLIRDLEDRFRNSKNIKFLEIAIEVCSLTVFTIITQHPYFKNFKMR